MTVALILYRSEMMFNVSEIKITNVLEIPRLVPNIWRLVAKTRSTNVLAER